MTLEYLEIMEEKNQIRPKDPSAETTIRKVRGTMIIKPGDEMEFRAQRSTGESSQEEIAKTAAGKLYRTVGEKKQSMVAHIVVPEGESDPRAFLLDGIDKLTKHMESKAAPKLKGRVLADEPNMRITLSKKESKVELVLGIDLKATPNYTSALMNLMYKVNQCFAINKTSLTSAR